MKKHSGAILLTLLVIIVLQLYVPAILDGGPVSVQQLRMFLPCLCVFSAAAVLKILLPKCSDILFAVALFALCVCESVIGFLQIFRVMHSNHELFCLTGTLGNPGPFGGLIAVCMAVTLPCIRRKDWLRYPAVAAFAMGALILPASMSRAAWLALAVAALAFGVTELDWKKRLKTLPRFWYGVALAVGVLAVAGVFMLKPESAMGRLHIWHIYLLAMLEKPLSGWGVGYRGYAYGQTQADYYSCASRSDFQISMANCPYESFNEYLSLGVEGGVPTFFLAVAIAAIAVVILWKKHSPFAYGLICLLVFAGFSYPLAVTYLVAPLAVMLAFACFDDLAGVHRWWSVLPLSVICSVLVYLHKTGEYDSSRDNAQLEFQYAQMYLGSGSFDSAARAMEPLMPFMADNQVFLYTYGQTLQRLGRYEESNAVLKFGAAVSCDPDFHVLMGQNYEAMGKYEDAEMEYAHAINMVPCRLQARCLLMELKVKEGKQSDAEVIAEEALRLPVNGKLKTMLGFRDRIRDCADTL